MTARWHLGPISGWAFWWLLVTSPEILIFLFFMITDPMTIPRGRVARVVYAVGVGLLATLLIAPQTTEYATKVAVLGRARPRLRSSARCSSGSSPAGTSAEAPVAAWVDGLTQPRACRHRRAVARLLRRRSQGSSCSPGFRHVRARR